MIYLDTSCLLKLLWKEPESGAVRDAIDREQSVIVSALAELEAEVQLKAAAAGGGIRTSQWRQYQAKLASMRDFDPFYFRVLPAALLRPRCNNTGIPDLRIAARWTGSILLQWRN